jgi:hypothetical protein
MGRLRVMAKRTLGNEGIFIELIDKLISDKKPLFARPLVLRVARVREIWFFAHIHLSDRISEWQAGVKY